MTKKRAFVGILCLVASALIFIYYIWGMLLTEAAEGMFASTDMPVEKSSNYLAHLLPPAAVLFLAIAIWLLVGPIARKLIMSIYRRLGK
jgi:hypothetical protein